MDDREGTGGLAGLVGLEVPDEMPPGAGQPRCLPDLALRLLDFVLAEIPLPGLPRRAHTIGIEGLGDGDQGDLRRVAAGAPGGGVDARPDLCEVRGDRL